MSIDSRCIPLLAFLFTSCTGSVTPGSALEPRLLGEVELLPCMVPDTSFEAWCGSYEVWEDRAAEKGRRIALNIMVLPSKASKPESDPVFHLAGGPGGSATRLAPGFVDSWLRDKREIV